MTSPAQPGRDRALPRLSTAGALAERYHLQVQQALGTAPPRTPERQAMWTEEPEYQEWAKQERERAIKLAEEQWRDPNRLAADLRG